MKKTSRVITLLLILALLCGAVAVPAGADVATLGIAFTGISTAADGTETKTTLEGTFTVLQDGEEIGTIRAGKETLTLNGTGRIRIVPKAETIEPGWDLSGAARDVYPEAGGTTIVPVTVKRAEAPRAETPAPPAEEPDETPEPPAETYDVPVETLPPEETDGTEEEELPVTPDPYAEPDPTAPAYTQAPVVTPTLPPYESPEPQVTPEPQWETLKPGDDTGTVRAFAYIDRYPYGQSQRDDPIDEEMTVILLTGDGEPVAYTVTGSDGIALFENVPAGEYRLRVLLPAGWSFSRKGNTGAAYDSLFEFTEADEATSDAFRVTAGQETLPGIAMSRTLHVSGACWFESTPDGVYGKNEPMLPGVRIELDGVKNGRHYETVSGADGTWYFDRVSPALYTLTAYVPEGMMFARIPTVRGTKSVIIREGVDKAGTRIDLNDNESKENLMIGFAWTGQVKGRCFLDANYNGVYDEGEEPMPGVKITAIKQNKDEEIAVTYSGEDGTYTLTGLRGNTYRMRAVLPDDGSDFTRVVSDPLGNHFQARPGRRENFWPDFVLADAQTREMNVGVIYPATVTGTVYFDDDFSATLNGKERIVSGFLVTLLDENGNAVAYDKTSIKGLFEITDVPPGTYTLSVNAVRGYAFTKPGEGNVILNRNGGEGYSEPFTLSIGEKKTGMDVGMIQPGTVEGVVFADRNDNGVRDEGENGLTGVTVRMIGEEGEVFRAEITESGKFLFDAVMPGRYHLEYDLPENAAFARTVNGGNAISGENGTGAGEEFDFPTGGYVQAPLCGALTLGRIEGTVYQDHDGDGLMGEDEETLEGLTLILTPARGDLKEIRITTGEDGSFLFDGLHPDNYTLTAECPEGRVLSRTDHLDLPLEAGSDTQSVALPLAMGREWKGQMIGAVIPASLSGQLWMDENNNGLFDEGEKTPAGLPVTVTDNLTGAVFDTLLTDEEGKYATSGMIPGSFTVSFPLDAQTDPAPAGDSVFTEIGGRLVHEDIQLHEDEMKDGLLIGIIRYTTIAGSAWIDRGSSVETLPGAVITLLDGEGNTLKSMTTGENGEYRFEKLMPGTYQLAATVPEGCVIIEQGDRRLAGGSVSVITDMLNREGTSDMIELKMAEDMRKMDIGCVLPGRLGDVCWLDTDGDGLQGMGEEGIPDVKIVLLRDGEIIAETVSDQYGFYRFSDLYPASYTLRVTPPGEVKPTRKRTDIPHIVSVLDETEDAVCATGEIRVESDRSNYNADLGFVCRKPGILPPGVGEGTKQNWTQLPGSDR